MRYRADTDNFPECFRDAEIRTGRVYDADGIEIPALVAIDTETGFGIQQFRVDGQLMTTFNFGETDARKELVCVNYCQFKTPIRFEELNGMTN